MGSSETSFLLTDVLDLTVIGSTSSKMASCSCSIGSCGCNSIYLRTLTGILKIIEIILCLVALGIFRSQQEAFFGGKDANIFGGGVLVSALIISPLFLFCYLCGRLDVASTTILEPATNLILCVFLGISGALAIGTGWNASFALGAFCIGAAITYGVDIVQRYIKC